MSTKKDDIDLFALRRDKEMTPGARLDWLAAARDFAMMPRKQAHKEKPGREA
jgi:hypothetical protein